MNSSENSQHQAPSIPEFKQILGHPAPLWMLFMSEFWERFAFYGIRWALVLYVVAQFHNGDASGQAPANFIYGSYLALVYASALFGGYVADRFIGYQRSILLGAVFMASGLFMIAYPNPEVFKFGLATIVIGNGMFKPNISTLVGKLYAAHDTRRDVGFTIFYMGINTGGLLAPLITGLLADKIFGSPEFPAYKIVFITAGIGMILSLIWFAIGRRSLQGVGAPASHAQGMASVWYVAAAALAAIPISYLLLSLDSIKLLIILMCLFLGLCGVMLREGILGGVIARDKVIAMLVIFIFNMMFWMFFEQAGSSFTFLADKIVDRNLWGFIFPTGWFQSVNSIAIVALAPVVAAIWLFLRRFALEPSIPRKFSFGLIGNGLAFGLLMFALSSLVSANNTIPFWTLIMVYIIQSAGEACLSPIGLSMVTKLAPVRLAGLGMGGWFLSTGIGNNMSGIFAAYVSGEKGLSIQSALEGYTFGFYALVSAGVFLFLIAPFVRKLMHGVN